MSSPKVVSSLLMVVLAVAAAADAEAQGLTITPSRNPAPAGITVTFSFSPKVIQASDTVEFNFGDGMRGTVAYNTICAISGGCGEITHTYAGAGVFNVTGSGSIGGHTVSGSVEITITAETADADLYVATAAHLRGLVGTNWRTDLTVHNYGAGTATYRLYLLKRDTDNGNAPSQLFTLGSGSTQTFPDVLAQVLGFTGAAALRIVPVDGSLIVTSRTYNLVDPGSYGSLVMGAARAGALSDRGSGRLVGLAHDPTLRAGYRTNLGLVNASPAPISVEAQFTSHTGRVLGTKRYELRSYEYRQWDKVFEQVTASAVEDGVIVLRSLTAGARFFAYAAMVDNVTGDPLFVPAVFLP